MMIKCPECGKEISSKALSCPHCGCPISDAKAKVVDAEVTPVRGEAKAKEAAPVVEKSKDNALIAQYEKEVESLRHKRSAMITWGVILCVVGIIGIIVMTILFTLGIVKEVPKAGVDDEELAARIIGLSVMYYVLIVVSAFVLVGGQVLIILGAVPNSIKITKRMNKIRELRK